MVWDEIVPLLKKHYDEMPFDPSIPLSPDKAVYDALERNGRLAVLTARDGDRLVGYFVAFLTRHAHYDILTAAMDIYFLLPEYRRGINGLLFFKAFEDAMREKGVKLILATARMDMNLGAQAVFQKLGWEQSRVVFQKRLD